MADYISREPMIREMQQLYEGVPYNFPNSTYTEWEILRGKYAAFIDYLKQQPAADVQPVRHGKWLSRCEGDIYAFSECSECGNTESCETPYCAQCGAKMDAEPDEPWQSD